MSDVTAALIRDASDGIVIVRFATFPRQILRSHCIMLLSCCLPNSPCTEQRDNSITFRGTVFCSCSLDENVFGRDSYLSRISNVVSSTVANWHEVLHCAKVSQELALRVADLKHSSSCESLH